MKVKKNLFISVTHLKYFFKIKFKEQDMQILIIMVTNPY